MNDVEQKDSVGGLGRHTVNASLEIDSRLTDVICPVEQLKQEVLNAYGPRTSRMGSISDGGERTILRTRSHLVMSFMSFRVGLTSSSRHYEVPSSRDCFILGD